MFVDDEDDDDAPSLKRLCTMPDLERQQPKPLPEGSNVETFGERLFTGPITPLFAPLHLMSEWKEPSTRTRRLSVAVVLP